MIFDVWMEGFLISGGSAKAKFLGCFTAATFKEACLIAVKHNNLETLYDKERNTAWGCGLFDNEADARESFG